MFLTSAPSLAYITTIAFPIPERTPVTIATLPSSLPILYDIILYIHFIKINKFFIKIN